MSVRRTCHSLPKADIQMCKMKENLSGQRKVNTMYSIYIFEIFPHKYLCVYKYANSFEIPQSSFCVWVDLPTIIRLQ